MDREITLEEELDLEETDASLPSRSSLMMQIAQLRMILEVSRSLSSTLDLETLLRLIIEVATEATDTEVASLLLLDEETGELHFEAATSANRAELKKIPVPLEGSIAGWIVCNNETLVVDDAHQDPRCRPHRTDEEPRHAGQLGVEVLE